MIHHGNWRRSLVPAGLLIALGAVAFGISGESAVDARKAPALVREAGRITIPAGSPYFDHIVVTEVEEKSVRTTLILPGIIEADPARTINILPPVTGKVVELLVQLGDRVIRGRPLAVIESGGLGQAYADHDRAAETFRLTKLVLDRARALADAGGTPVKDLQQAESDNAQARTELTRAQARLKEIGAGAEMKGRDALVIRAPVSGSITSLSIASGAYANNSSASLMTISNLDEVWVTANAPESNVAFIKPGMTVDVTLPAYPDQHFPGKVTSVSAVLEPDTRRAKVRIAFPNQNEMFKPNMFANVTLVAPPSSGLFVPTSALLMNNDRVTVFVEVSPGTFEQRVVEEGQEADDQALIRQGLRQGERIISKGGVLLND